MYPPANRSSGGGSSMELAGDYRYVIDESTGALELWKGEEKIGIQSPDGSWFRTAVSTGVGSLHLGGGESSDPAHSVSSSGQNVVFKSEAYSETPGAAMVWFPPWQGLRQDMGGTPVTPTYMQFGDLMSSYEPNGSAHGSNIVSYDLVNTNPQSVVVSRMQCAAGETYSGKVKIIIMSSPKSVELHASSQTVNITAGSLFWLELLTPFFARQGDSIRTIIRKENGQPLKVRGGLINTAHPWRRFIARSFTAIMVGNIHYGDVKDYYGTNDHNGWVFLNGRAVSTLTATQQAVCTQIGIAGNLPNTIDRVTMGAGGSYPRGTAGGGVKISKAMLPNITVTGRTDSGDAHKHGPGNLATGPESGHRHTASQLYSWSTRRLDGGDDATGPYNFPNFTTQNTSESTGHTHNSMTGDTANESTHRHYFTSDSINGNVTQADFVPMYTAFGKFIYLGL